MIFAAHQPGLMPYTGFFQKLLRVDVFGLMVDVQFVNDDYHHRVKVGNDSNASWLTVPVNAPFKSPINTVTIANNYSPVKMLGKLENTYRNTKYWKDYHAKLGAVFSAFNAGDRLFDLNFELLSVLVDIFEIRTKIVEVHKTGDGASLDLVSWTQASQCGVYLSGSGARNYLDEPAFIAQGLEVSWHVPSLPTNLETVSVITGLFEQGPSYLRDLESSL